MRVGVALGVLVPRLRGHQPGEPRHDVAGNGSVGAFIDGDPRGGVGNEDVDHTL